MNSNNVSKFYNSGGWSVLNHGSSSDTKDAILFEDLRPISQSYLRRIRLDINKYISKLDGEAILDFASGPIQYPEYLTYSQGFKNRFCVDFSSSALETASFKLNDHGKYFVGDYLSLGFPDNYFDCSLCIHTLYHINKDNQAQCVQKLINETKIGGNIVILYSNPTSLNRLLRRLLSFFGWSSGKPKLDLYFYAHPLSWWRKNFSTQCEVKIYTWRLFESAIMKLIIPNNRFGKYLLKAIYLLQKLDNFIVRNIADYPVIILKKK